MSKLFTALFVGLLSLLLLGVYSDTPEINQGLDGALLIASTLIFIGILLIGYHIGWTHAKVLFWRIEYLLLGLVLFCNITFVFGEEFAEYGMEFLDGSWNQMSWTLMGFVASWVSVSHIANLHTEGSS